MYSIPKSLLDGNIYIIYSSYYDLKNNGCESRLL